MDATKAAHAAHVHHKAIHKSTDLHKTFSLRFGLMYCSIKAPNCQVENVQSSSIY